MFSVSYFFLKVSPHILNYGRVDEATKSLKFPLSRPCDAGEQCFLSYGKHPGSHLLTFYGFLPRGDNPYDVIPLDLDTSADDEDITAQSSATTSQTTHMVRGTWLSTSGGFPTYGLPQPLLTYLRAALGCEVDEPAAEADMKESDKVVLETILSIFSPMLEALLPEQDDPNRESASWDVKLASDYKDLQRKIVSSIVTSCTSALENL
ncbi:SET domain-containing protein [Zea mays]|uniref:SET domain-containing protein n=1 Tax=Zea mays TaxID=4577 RepID=A0A1D6IZ62_MAIZE|nr:SET domain-containing protein [Zea mays]